MSGARAVRALAGVRALLAPAGARAAAPPPQDLHRLLGRAAEQVAGYLDLLSDVQCLEHVRQEKLGEDGKVLEARASTYHYLVILGSAAGAITVDEARHPVEGQDGERTGGGPPLLVSNGFAMLSLVFHPYYARSFDFSDGGEDAASGRRLRKVAFVHVHGTPSPAALELRGRDYALELAGTAWIDPDSGVIARIRASVGDSMADVGLRALSADVAFAPAPFPDMAPRHWVPQVATVEVATARQRWRNVHRFDDYRRFSVSTQEEVAGP